MNRFKYGKISMQLFESVILRKLGEKRSEVIVGPNIGFDNGVVRIGDNKVLIVTTDPMSFIPTLGPEDSAWFSVHEIASDLSTSGFSPQYAVFDFNLPPKITDAQFKRYWNSLHVELERLGVAVAAGHTGRFEGCDFTIIGGGMMMSTGPEDSYLTPGMAKPGDKVIVTKGAAIECTGVLARVFPKKISSELGSFLLGKAKEYFYKMSVVREALIAARIGTREKGVTAMHDAAEGGLLSALYEVALASQTGLSVSKSEITISEETKAICKLFKIDPLSTISEGSLVITVKPGKAEELLNALKENGIPASVVGEIKPKKHGIKIKQVDGTESKIHYPIVDPYWKAFWHASKLGWK
jgi:hydrogenase maturation factor